MAAEAKTKPTDGDVAAFLAGVTDERRRADAVAVNALMAEVTGERPVLWGRSIVGFGVDRTRNAAGNVVAEWPVVGLSPRKAALVLYLKDGFPQHADLLARLGPHTTGRGCLYLKRLDEVDADVLRELIAAAMAHGRG